MLMFGYSVVIITSNEYMSVFKDWEGCEVSWEMGGGGGKGVKRRYIIFLYIRRNASLISNA